MKYTKSRDGIMRANLHVTLRVTRDDYQWLAKQARHHNMRIADFLHVCLQEGLTAEQERADDEARAAAEEEERRARAKELQ